MGLEPPTSRRTRRCALALSLAALTLAAPAPASADVLGVFQKLSDQRLNPAPLVPTTAPRSLRPIDETITAFEPRRGYGVALIAGRRGIVDRVVQLQGGAYATSRAALRSFRATGYRQRSTTVRGRRGYLLSRGSTRALLWTEGRVVYYIGTFTPKTVSLGELRATATGLDRLEGVFTASVEEGRTSADVGATSRTVTVDLRFEAQCVETATGERSGPAEGQARVTLLPRQGDSFSFDVASNLLRDRSDPYSWQGTVGGSIGADGGVLNVRATGSDTRDTCDTGPLSLTLSSRPPL